MAEFRQPEARDSIWESFEELGTRDVRTEVDWQKLLKVLKDKKVVQKELDERVMKAVWARHGGGRPFTHVELRAGVFEEYSRPRPGEIEDDGHARRERLLREEALKHKETQKEFAKARQGSSKGRFDYSANWGHIAESDEDSDREEEYEKAGSYIENHRRRGNAKFEQGEHTAAASQYTAALVKYAEMVAKMQKRDDAAFAAVAVKSLPDDEDLAKLYGNRIAVLLKIISTRDGTAAPPVDPSFKLPAFVEAKALDPSRPARNERSNRRRPSST